MPADGVLGMRQTVMSPALGCAGNIKGKIYMGRLRKARRIKKCCWSKPNLKGSAFSSSSSEMNLCRGSPGAEPDGSGFKSQPHCLLAGRALDKPLNFSVF